MKKIFSPIFCCLLLSLSCFSQSINWEWAVATSNTNGQQEGYDVTTDSTGNVYITGSFNGTTINFGSTILNNGGTTNGFLAKYSTDGNVIWAVSPTTNIGDVVEPTHIAIDGEANVYIAGTYFGTGVVYETTVLPATFPNSSNAFVAKYDSLGGLIWVRTAGINSYAAATGVATDMGGNVYVTGYFQNDSINFDNIILHNYLNNPSHYSVFVVKYDSLGQVVWAKSPRALSSQAVAASRGIVTDLAGNAYVTGYYSDSIRFGNTTLHAVGSANTFLAKYDGQGNVGWAKSAGFQDDLPFGIATDGNSHVYITGDFSSTYTYFDTIKLTNTTPNGQRDALFITQYDTAGNAIWAKTAGAQLTTIGYGLATDGCGNVYCTGGFAGPSITFDTFAMAPTSGIADALYLVEFSPAGKLISAGVLGSGGDDQSGIHIDSKGNSYLISDFENLNPFVVGNDSLVLSGGETVFLAKFSCTACSQDSLGYNLLLPAICKGDIAVLNFTGGSGINVSPLSDVFLINTQQAWLDPDTTTVFTITGYQYCDDYVRQTFTVPVLDSNGISINASNPGLCPNDSAQLCVPSGFSTYNWSTGDSTACIHVHNGGNYSITITNIGQCSATGSHAIISYETAAFNVSQQGDTLSYSTGSNYRWLLDGDTIAGATSSAYITHAAGTYILQITDSNGCTETSNPVVILGVSDITDRNITVYPNPSAGIWQLDLDNNLPGGVAEVFDAEGHLVFKTEIKARQSEIGINAASGIYILRITSVGVTVVRKLVRM